MSDRYEQHDGSETAGKHYEHVLISVSNPQTADQLIRLACRLTDTSAVLHIVSVTVEAPFPERASSWRRSSQLVMDMTHLANRLGRVAKPLATTARSIPGAIVDAADEMEADLIIMGWFGRVTPLAVRKSRVVNKVLHKASCDTAVLKVRGELSEVERLIVPVGGQINEDRLGVVKKIQWHWPTDVVLVHVLTPDEEMTEQDAREMLVDLADRVGPGAEPRVVRDNTIVDGLLGVAEEDDLIIIGPGREWVFSRFLFGRHADQITNRAPCSVLMTKSKEQKVTAWSRGLLKAITQRITGSSE